MGETLRKRTFFIKEFHKSEHQTKFLDTSVISSIIFDGLFVRFISTYAIIVMPGLSNFNDKGSIGAFQVTDAELQKNQPKFMCTWIGSIVSVFRTILISIFSSDLSEASLIALIRADYLLDLQCIAIAIHIPLNNLFWKVIIKDLNYQDINEAPETFERKWPYLNNIRKC